MASEIYAYRWGSITQTGSGPAWSAPSSTYPYGSVSLPVGSESATRSGVAGTLVYDNSTTGDYLPDAATIQGVELQVTIGELSPGASGVSTPTFLIQSAVGGPYADVYETYRGLTLVMGQNASDGTQTQLRATVEKDDENFLVYPASNAGKTPVWSWFTKFRPALGALAAGQGVLRVIFQGAVGDDYKITVENPNTGATYSVTGLHNGTLRTVDVTVPFATDGTDFAFYVRVYSPTVPTGPMYIQAVNLYSGSAPPLPPAGIAGSTDYVQVYQKDTDGDGIADVDDPYPNDPTNNQGGVSTPTDADGDGVTDPTGAIFASDVEMVVGGVSLGDIGQDKVLSYGTYIFGGPTYTGGRTWTKADLANVVYRFRAKNAMSSPGFVGVTNTRLVIYADPTGGSNPGNPGGPGNPPQPATALRLHPRRIPPYRKIRNGR